MTEAEARAALARLSTGHDHDLLDGRLCQRCADLALVAAHLDAEARGERARAIEECALVAFDTAEDYEGFCNHQGEEAATRVGDRIRAFALLPPAEDRDGDLR